MNRPFTDDGILAFACVPLFSWWVLRNIHSLPSVVDELKLLQRWTNIRSHICMHSSTTLLWCHKKCVHLQAIFQGWSYFSLAECGEGERVKRRLKSGSITNKNIDVVVSWCISWPFVYRTNFFLIELCTLGIKQHSDDLWIKKCRN